MAVLAIHEEPEAMTPSWLTTALRESDLLTEAVVTAVRWQPLATQGWTTQMARLAMTYKESEAGLPATLVVKLSAREASTRAFFGRFYAREVAFYRWVAPKVSLRVPRCYYADYEAATHAHVLLLEDVTPVVADDLLHGVSEDVGAAYIRSIAALHAHWWEHARLSDLMGYFPAHGARFAEGYVASLERGLAVMRPYLTPATATLATRVQWDLQTRWDSQYAALRTLIHWDAQVANFLRSTRVETIGTVVDWQHCRLSPMVTSVAQPAPCGDRRGFLCAACAPRHAALGLRLRPRRDDGCVGKTGCAW